MEKHLRIDIHPDSLGHLLFLSHEHISHSHVVMLCSLVAISAGSGVQIPPFRCFTSARTFRSRELALWRFLASIRGIDPSAPPSKSRIPVNLSPQICHREDFLRDPASADNPSGFWLALLDPPTEAAASYVYPTILTFLPNVISTA